VAGRRLGELRVTVIDRLLENRSAGFVFAVVAIAAVVDVCWAMRGSLNNAVVALALDFVVLAVAAGWGSLPALLAAALGAAGFSFVVAPPTSLVTISAENWFVLAALGVTGVTTGQLSSRARRRAREAEAGRKEAMLLATRLQRTNRAYRALGRCNETLIRATDEGALLQQVCGIVVQEAGYRLCWVGRAENDSAKSVRPIARAGFDAGYMTGLKVTWADTDRGRGPVGSCIRTRQTVLVSDISVDPRMTPWRDEALKRGYSSVIAIPLVVDSTAFGALAIYAGESESFGPEETALLTNLAEDLAFGIATLRTRLDRVRAMEDIRLLNASLEQRVAARTSEIVAARAREVNIGIRIQNTLLLDPPPRDVAGLRVAALTIPSQQIDGDFYDFFEYRNRCFDVIVADVMGKGIPAALLGAATKISFTDALCHLLDVPRDGQPPAPSDIVERAHADIVRQLIDLESFVTLCYCRFDVAQQTVALVDCGHTGTIHLHHQTGLCDVLHGDNLPLGIREGETYHQIAMPFDAGDVFVVFSDGITEAANGDRELFGMDRLLECVRLNRELEPEALVDAIRTAVFTFHGSDRLSDDLTCVAIKVVDKRSTRTRAELEIRSDLRELRRTREFVRAGCHDLAGSRLSEEQVAELELAVTEAASNVIEHAYADRGDRQIQLELEAFPDRIALRLYYLGDPFDPSKVPPPAFDGSRESGFGVYLIAQSVDDVRYFRNESGENCIVLVKVYRR
jgi:sigma-B regulation protein RsbU (phosphoserine phosphatase)